jgi:hypothetical protein
MGSDPDFELTRVLIDSKGHVALPQELFQASQAKRAKGMIGMDIGAAHLLTAQQEVEKARAEHL